jgi:hypothetical protein
MKKHFIFRVKDGKNFENSIYPFWGIKRGNGGGFKTQVTNNINEGDILWFMTSKAYGGKIIAMAEYCGFYDRNDEPLLQINTKTNEEQGWKGDECWDIQIHYSNLYNTKKQNILACIQCGGIILEYETFKDRINSDLYEHYKNFKFYAEPKVFTN